MTRAIPETQPGEVRFECDYCDRVENLPLIKAALGGTDAMARARGYRLTSAADDAKVICPECAGTDEDYWDRQTLSVAYMAGIDAGAPNWWQS